MLVLDAEQLKWVVMVESRKHPLGPCRFLKISRMELNAIRRAIPCYFLFLPSRFLRTSITCCLLAVSMVIKEVNLKNHL